MSAERKSILDRALSFAETMGGAAGVAFEIAREVGKGVLQSLLGEDDQQTKDVSPPTKASGLRLHWSRYPDTARPGHDIHDVQLPSGDYVYVQEVSAPGPGCWGWLLMDSSDTPVEMRNGFDDDLSAKKHVEKHLAENYPQSGL